MQRLIVLKFWVRCTRAVVTPLPDCRQGFQPITRLIQQPTSCIQSTIHARCMGLCTQVSLGKNVNIKRVMIISFLPYTNRLRIIQSNHVFPNTFLLGCSPTYQCHQNAASKCNHHRASSRKEYKAIQTSRIERDGRSLFGFKDELYICPDRRMCS